MTVAAPAPRKRRFWHAVELWVALAIAVVVAAIGLAVRYGVDTGFGRGFIEARLDGLSVGRLGRLHVEGLAGDFWTDFTVSRLTIADADGVWLDVRKLAISWRPFELVARRAHLTSVAAGLVRVDRLPALSPSGGAGQSPVAVNIDSFAMRLETLPAASVRRGLFAVTGGFDVERNGGVRGAVDAESQVHPGDGLTARFDFGVRQRLAIDAVGREESGGALAGLAGLPADQPFALNAHLGGANGQGGLALLARSGTTTIAQATGAWTPAGGRAAGRLSLIASRLTQPLARGLGAEVTFTAASHVANDGLYGVALIADSDNASLKAVGVGDPARFTADEGLSIQATVADMHRLVSVPAMGAASLSGQLTGGWANVRLTGQGSVERLGFAGYQLARVSGSVDLSHERGDWRLKASLAGQGGAGQGLWASLIGARPQASLDATRLADGRTLIRALKATGAAVVVDATGQQGLFGDLSLKGDARIADLAALRAGARGVVEASWTAGQPRGARSWTFAMDARGAKVASGIEALDGLLGQTPVLSGHGSYTGGVVDLNAASLTGAAADANAAGQIGADGALKLALGWSSRGPIELGPLEITGQAKGTGAVTGAVAQPRLDLISDFEAISLPQLTLRPAHVVLSFIDAPTGATGALTLAAASDYGPAHAHTDLHFLPTGVALSGIDAAGGGVTVRGALTLTQSQPSPADLTVDVGPGAVLTQGHASAKVILVDASGGANLDLALKAADVELRGGGLTASDVTLNANGPVAHAPYRLAADMVWAGTPVQLQGEGVASELAQGYAATFEGSGRLRKAPFRTLTPAQLSFGGAASALQARLSVGSGRIDLDAHQTAGTFSATAKLAGVDVASLDPDYAGKVNADLSLNGRDQALGGTLTAQLSGARVSDAPSNIGMDGDLKAVLSGQRIDLAANAQDSAGGRANLTLALPAVATAAPFRIAIAETQPMSGAFALSGEVEPVWALLFGGERSLGGQVNAQGQIGGTLDDPQVTGQGALANGRFEDAPTGLKLRDVAAAADFEGAKVDLKSFRGLDARSGAISGQGTLDLTRGGQSSLTLVLKGFQLLDNETASVIASGPLTLSRDANGRVDLAGQLTIDRSTIAAQMSRSPPGIVAMDVIERNRPAALDQGVGVPTSHGGLAVGLDITLRSSGGVVVQGLGLNAEMSLDAKVTGDTGHPVLSGVARVVRGDYQFGGQRFAIDNRGVVYLASSPNDIRLNLSATRSAEALTAVISITGTAAKPVIALSSTPSLPNDEILAQVLFGSSAAQLSPVQAAELAAALTTLATGGGFDVMGGLQNFAKLDRLALGGGSASGVTVSGGKYIGKNVYLELTGGGRAGPSAEVDVQSGHGLAIVSQVGGQVGEKLAIRWRRDYGAPPAH
ncbi:MAG TPA: translocation/assembly module TamB domain-containing protein [Caulobacteraceae bacterium]|nr:translocation/assembly module TamB domain-containing protein [Caulobacteraceae bacterium]